MHVHLSNPNRVVITALDILKFKESWPGSGLISTDRWVEFGTNGDLVDHNFLEREDGPAVLALTAEAEEVWRKEHEMAR